MITHITNLGDYICFFKGEGFELKPITLLVGDQGCGKSTLLKVIRDVVLRKGDHDCFDTRFKEPLQSGCYYLDMEKNNPGIELPNPDDAQEFMYMSMARFESHGETLFPILKCLGDDDIKDVVILLDEPETALSLRSQYKLIEIFKKCLEQNCQIIIATHNIVFMEAFPDSVLSLEHMRYMTPDEFVDLEKESNNIKLLRQDRRIKKENCRMGTECECTKEKPFYDNKCVHYVDRDGTSGYDRDGWGGEKMKKGDFKNG